MRKFVVNCKTKRGKTQLLALLVEKGLNSYHERSILEIIEQPSPRVWVDLVNMEFDLDSIGLYPDEISLEQAKSLI